MTEPPKKTPGLEVESQSLQDELIAIKDRLSAIETIASISNATVVKKYVEDHLLTDKGIAIMKECEGDPRTRNYLKTTLDFKSDQALDYHLKPLREADLLRPRVESGAIVFEWSNLFGRLPKSTIRAILGKPK